MKILKIFLLSLFFVSVFFSATYGEEKKCVCSQSGPGKTFNNKKAKISKGTIVKYQVQIDMMNEVPGKWVSAHAAIIGLICPIPGLHHIQSAVGYYHDEIYDFNGVVINNDRIVYLYCGAQVSDNNYGSGASSFARIYW